MRVEYRCVICLKRPRTPRVIASNTRRACAAHRVLRIVVIETIDICSEHQVLVLSQLVVQPPIDQSLAVVTFVVETSVRRQYECRQSGREERRSILVCVVRRHKKEGLVFDDWPTNRSGYLLQRIRDVNRIDSPKCSWCNAGKYGRRTEIPGRKSFSLPVTRPEHIDCLAVKQVRAGFCDYVQRRARG